MTPFEFHLNRGRFILTSAGIFGAVTLWLAVAFSEPTYWGFWQLFFKEFAALPWIRVGIMQVFIILLLAEAAVYAEFIPKNISRLIVPTSAASSALASTTVLLLFLLPRFPSEIDAFRAVVGYWSLFAVHHIGFTQFVRCIRREE